MRGERYQNAMAILLVVLVFASVPLVLSLPGWWFLWAPVLAALALLPATFLREADLGTVMRAPEAIRESLLSNARGAVGVVRAESSGVTMRLNALAAVRFRLRVSEAGTMLSSELRPTAAGWAVLALLVASVVGSPLAIATTLGLAWRARRFASSKATEAMSASSAAPGSLPPDEVRSLLIGSLSSALRIADEAIDAQGKAYTDARVYVTIGAFVLWTALLIGVFLALNGFNLLTGRWEVPIVAATAGALLSGGALLAALRQRYAPRLSRYRTWIDRLRVAMGRELARTVSEPTPASAFELLVETSAQIPEWLEARRKAGVSADPWTAFALLVLSGFCASMVINGLVSGLRGDSSVVPIYGVAAAAGAGIAAWITVRWQRHEKLRLARAKSDWEARLLALRARMDRFLEEI